MKRRHKLESGASLVEVLIVLVIVTVIVSFAVSRVGRAGNNMQRQNMAREFKVSLERARFDSVKRRANTCANMSRVSIPDSSSFVVTTDLNQNGTLETAESQTISMGGRSDVTIVGNGVTFPLTIRFDERGHALLTDCVTTPVADVPLLYFCNGVCTPDTANGENSNVIFVSPTGTVAMLRGGQAMPTFANPNVSNINSTVQVNPMLAIWDLVTGTPQPTATPSGSPLSTPVSTPTPIATPTATATPITLPTATPITLPTATPVPTSTPYYCATSSPWQSPSQTGCICQSPLWVRSNGKCR